eukprot:SAG11_NODE_17475_length_517_cov_1.483254_1_plen_60_part_10
MTADVVRPHVQFIIPRLLISDQQKTFFATAFTVADHVRNLLEVKNSDSEIPHHHEPWRRT